MIDVEQKVREKFPSLGSEKPLARHIVKLLKVLCHEDEINGFIALNQHLSSFEFLEKILEHFDFSYSVSNKDRENIPADGRAIVVANHPIGSLDGLALLKFIKEIRVDVHIVTNDLLYSVEPLRELFIPLDNISDKNNYKKAYREILSALRHNEIVVFFPAGEVSRIKPNGVKDGEWRTGFLHFVEKMQTPVIPIFVDARNSAIFYSLSMLFKPLGTAMLAREMFNKNHQNIGFQISRPIAYEALKNLKISKKSTAKLLRKHTYALAKKKRKYVIETEKPVAHPTNRAMLKRELKRAEILGQTRDNKKILLLDYQNFPHVMQEIGRLRELSFRLVQEGTGGRIDLDDYDRYYRHLVLWDEDDLEIVGAYRLGECAPIMQKYGIEGLYTHTLFDFHPPFKPYLEHAIELGRSFIQPRYWGLRGLDYLWYGIGAYLRQNPECQYLFGPVTLSNSYPERAKSRIVSFYQSQFANPEKLVEARHPLPAKMKSAARAKKTAGDYRENFKRLERDLKTDGVQVPTLYKQYTELCDDNGSTFLDFSIDPNFSHCIDGLILVEVAKIKAKKRRRYIEDGEKMKPQKMMKLQKSNHENLNDENEIRKSNENLNDEN